MKIEDYKGYMINSKDLDYLKNNVEDSYKETVIGGEVKPIFEDLVLDKFDLNTFLKLSWFVQRMLRNSDDKTTFELSVKIAYCLIEQGEKDNSYIVEKTVADLYQTLGFIIYDQKEHKIIPYSMKRDILNIDADTKLAIKYFEKALLLDPSPYIFSVLGIYYYLNNNYYKAFAYLKNAQQYDSDYKWNYEFVDSSTEAYMYSKLGIYFENEYMNNNAFDNYSVFSADYMFVCFERAYMICDSNNWLDKDLIEMCMYNYAYAFIKGVGTKEDKEKGLEILKKLDDKLLEMGKDIFSIEDPDNIVKDYYKR